MRSCIMPSEILSSDDSGDVLGALALRRMQVRVLEDRLGVKSDALRAFEEALRVARAATHERKLERPIAEAFRAMIGALHAGADILRTHERALAELRALESQRVHRDP